MKRFALPLIFLLVFPTPTLAKSYRQQDSPANECDSLARACTGAVRELVAARKYIAGLEANIAAADERIRIAERQIQSLKEKGALQSEQVKELQTVIAAERDAKDVLLKVKAEQMKRILTLEKQLSRARKLTGFLAVAAAVGILIAVAK